ncbi:MAG: calcium/sodium antiporter [Thermodesulfobacteriota bacterium]|nr:calcium/sodium antiporter [Thermodesulfobacteriota bacterium]
MENLRWLWNGDALREMTAGEPAFCLIIIIVASLIMLAKGSDWMIDGVVCLAERTGISRIVIGSTIIALGTSLPEVMVSVMAAWMGNPGLALGNGVGSIIADSGLILGLTALLAPTPINRFILNRTGRVQVGAATLLVFIAIGALLTAQGTPSLERWVGFLFLFLLAVYIYMNYIWAEQHHETVETPSPGSKDKNLVKSWLMVAGGLALILAGARLLVPCASELAMRIGVPEDVIAATMVAFGTSLPELMSSFASIKKGHPEITVGIVVGSDVLNSLLVVGAAAAVHPLSIPPTFFIFHFPAMLIILYSFRLFIHFDGNGWFKRWQGAWLLGVYLVYVTLQYTLNVG